MKTTDSKKIVIIGAGIAGLSAAVYARMNGFDAEVFEMHSIPGGLCTAWKRKGYVFDGCLHWLTGSAPSDSFYELWKELGAVQGRAFHDHDIFYSITGTDGRTFSVYSDADRLEAHMKELAPADSKVSEEFCGWIRKFARFHMPMTKAFELYTAFDILPMLLRMRPFMKDLGFLSGISIGEYANRFTDPLLREALPRILMNGEMAMTSLIVTLSLLHSRAGGFPIGGSLEFAKSIERRAKDLGAAFHYNVKVEKILTEDGKAVGVRLEDGREVLADYVISAADLRTTLYGMLDGHHIDPYHAELLQRGKLFPSMVQVSFGVDMDLSGEPSSVGVSRRLDAPLTVGGVRQDWLLYKNYSFDPTLAPKGKSSVVCMFVTGDYAYWEKLASDPDAYRAEKSRIAELAATELEKIYPGFRDRIEVTDVATPATYVRYTGSWKGTFMTWVMTPGESNRLRTLKKTVPGLGNFYLSGMWVMAPGGVPTGAKTSRDVIQIICRKERREFRTVFPAAAGSRT